MRDLRAFTLMELLLVMMISGIVISVGYGAYSFIGEQMGTFRVLSSEGQNLNSGISLMKYEVFMGKRVRRINDTEISIEGETGIRYRMAEKGLIRYKDQMTDTFPMEISNISVLFENGLIVSDSALIDRISFQIQSNQETQITVIINKEYDAFELLENVELVRTHEQY